MTFSTAMNLKREMIERILIIGEILEIDEELELFWGHFDNEAVDIFLLSPTITLSCIQTEDD